jgi:hypothetical protein
MAGVIFNMRQLPTQLDACSLGLLRGPLRDPSVRGLNRSINILTRYQASSEPAERSARRQVSIVVHAPHFTD